MMVHDVTKLTVETIREHSDCVTGQYTARTIEITTKDGSTLRIALFGESAYDIALRG